MWCWLLGRLLVLSTISVHASDSVFSKKDESEILNSFKDLDPKNTWKWSDVDRHEFADHNLLGKSKNDLVIELSHLKDDFDSTKAEDHKIPVFSGQHNGKHEDDPSTHKWVSKIETALSVTHENLRKHVAETYMDEVMTQAAIDLLDQRNHVSHTTSGPAKTQRIRPGQKTELKEVKSNSHISIWGRPVKVLKRVPIDEHIEERRKAAEHPTWNPHRSVNVNGHTLSYTRPRGFRKPFTKTEKFMNSLSDDLSPETRMNLVNAHALKAQNKATLALAKKSGILMPAEVRKELQEASRIGAAYRIPDARRKSQGTRSS